MYAFAWMHRFVDQNGEQAPHLNRVYLQSWMTKVHVYNMYKGDCQSENQVIAAKVRSVDTFFDV